jgi:signal transduction histidine kinase
VGRGPPASAVYAAAMAGIHERGQGLRNLRERAERLGGRVEIAVHPGQGTRVRVTIPGRPGP